jgi:hypothetical protein
MSAVQAPVARELTAEEQQERAQFCFQIEQRIMKAIEVGRGALWELTASLYEFHLQNGWTALGHESMNEWLAQPEIAMTKTMYMRLVRRYRELVVNRNLPVFRIDPDVDREDDEDLDELAAEEPVIVLSELDPSKLDIVMPAIEEGTKKLDQILDDVKTLGARDLRETYFAPKPASSNGDASNGDAPNGEIVEGREVDEEELKRQTTVTESASQIASWLELGGDRRKARRHWARLQDLHPVLAALTEVQSCLEGGDEAPERAEVAEGAWKEVVKALHLTILS